MREAIRPENEAERLKFLRDLKVLDTPIEERFERITRIVCRSLNVPISAISLLDESRQWFKSIQGLARSETPRDIAFCSHAIVGAEPFIVSDATQDERFVDNPLVTAAPNIRFYAGFPLAISGDLRIGTLCAIDDKPREITPEQIEIMNDLRQMAQSELQSLALSEAYLELLSELTQSERAALVDPVSRLWNRQGAEKMLQREWVLAKRNGRPIGLALLDIDHFKQINDTLGHEAGDAGIRAVGEVLLSTLRAYDAVCRWGGDEFLCVFPNCERVDLENMLERVVARMAALRLVSASETWQLAVSIGGALATAEGDGARDLLAAADRALYEAKGAGRNTFAVKDTRTATHG
jgi:diguanylate cyclase (GGDEF)-like protein